MSEIFISYATADRQRIQPIIKILEKKGWSVWWDRKIPPGRIFDDVIEEAIDRSKCVIVIWSRESVNSRWVRTEAGEGERRGILIPIQIDDVEIPLAFRRIEAAQLIDWDGVSDHPELGHLFEAISRYIKPSVSGESSISSPDLSASFSFNLLKKPAISKVTPLFRVVSIIVIFLLVLWIGSWAIPKILSPAPTVEVSINDLSSVPTSQPEIGTATSRSSILPIQTNPSPDLNFQPKITIYDYFYYTVQSGDTWNSIALRFDADPIILQAINLSSLSVGKVLKIPQIKESIPIPFSQPPTNTLQDSKNTPQSSTSITQNGTLPDHEVACLRIYANKGQLMSVKLTTIGPAELGVLNQKGETFKPMNKDLEWNGIVPDEGLYRILIMSESAGFTYTIEVSLTSATIAFFTCPQ